jgi:hypothetical protein
MMETGSIQGTPSRRTVLSVRFHHRRDILHDLGPTNLNRLDAMEQRTVSSAITVVVPVAMMVADVRFMIR